MKNVFGAVAILLTLGLSNGHAGQVRFTLSDDVCVAESMEGMNAPQNGNLQMLGSKSRGWKKTASDRLCMRFQRRCGDPMTDWYCSTHSVQGVYDRTVP